MAGVITTGAHPKALWPGIKAIFGGAYDEHEEEFSKIFDRTDSDKKYEEYFEVTGFGLAPVKPEGDSVSYDSESQGYDHRLTNVTIALGYVVTMEELQDNLYEQVSGRRAKRLAFSMRQTKETIGANILNRAFSSSYLGGDSKELLATDHPTLDGTQANELSVAADLSEASLEDLIIQIHKAKNSRGRKIQLKPDSLIVPPDLWYEANRILKSTLQNDSANNAVNALKATNALPGGIVLNHYLTDSDAWFVKTKMPKGEGLIYQERMANKFEQDNDFDTKNAKAASVERYVFGWSDWRSLFGSPGA
jgi:hypothetical protein